MQILVRKSDYTLIHIYKSFFLLVSFKKLEFQIVELSIKSEDKGKKLPELITTPAGVSLHLRWDITITKLHIILLFLTILSTTLVGAMLQGISPISTDIWRGLYFSIPLILILFCHELGHIFAMWKNAVRSTFPYFIPAPNIIGTFGAVMILKERVHRSSEIVRIGAAGPIAGFICAIPICILGLYLSSTAEIKHETGLIKLGTPLIFQILQKLVFGEIQGNKDVLLSPVAFAGWIGFFVTAINLIPVGQSDGGHIAFGLFPRLHRLISSVFVITLFTLGIIFWVGWIVWAIVIAFLSLRAPSYTPEYDISKSEKLIGLASIAIFILTFVPTPISVEL